MARSETEIIFNHSRSPLSNICAFQIRPSFLLHRPCALLPIDHILLHHVPCSFGVHHPYVRRPCVLLPSYLLRSVSRPFVHRPYLHPCRRGDEQLLLVLSRSLLRRGGTFVMVRNPLFELLCVLMGMAGEDSCSDADLLSWGSR